MYCRLSKVTFSTVPSSLRIRNISPLSMMVLDGVAVLVTVLVAISRESPADPVDLACLACLWNLGHRWSPGCPERLWHLDCPGFRLRPVLRCSPGFPVHQLSLGSPGCLWHLGDQPYRRYHPWRCRPT